ncbi:MAG TPA: magnesium protoporphyrin IX methyltransferase [Roseiflexaceae bacterium]|nr:magnesium protoporphyrin IX methyltransferase [Roseiflexaceae bacterium]
MNDTHKTNLRAYFDGAGYERWAAIYGEGELRSRVRRTIRAGHSQMLGTALAWLDEGLAARGPQAHVLDAGCGTGLLTLALARRGHRVTAVDLAPQMANATAEAARRNGLEGRVVCRSGDLEQVEGRFDAVACLDVLVHYPSAGFARMLGALADLADGPLVVTYAPYNRLLAALHWLGGRFPKGERRTDIQMTPDAFVDATLAAKGMRARRRARVSRGFYHVTLVEAVRATE